MRKCDFSGRYFYHDNMGGIPENSPFQQENKFDEFLVDFWPLTGKGRNKKKLRGGVALVREESIRFSIGRVRTVHIRDSFYLPFRNLR